MNHPHKQNADFEKARNLILSGRFVYTPDPGAHYTSEEQVRVKGIVDGLDEDLKNLVNEALDVKSRIAEGRLTEKQLQEAWYLAWMIGDAESEAGQQAEMAGWFKILIDFADTTYLPG